MATYAELRGLFNDATLKNKISTACVIAAYGLIDDGTPTLAQKKFAEYVFSRPDEMAQKVMMAVLAANSAASLATINAASDVAIQNNVNAVIPALVDALFGA